MRRSSRLTFVIRPLTPLSLAWTVMNSNILSPWIAPDLDDECSNNRPLEGQIASTVSKVRSLIAKPFSRDNATLARSTLDQLTQLSVLYTDATYVAAFNLFKSYTREF